jgi:hypothetical protein
MLTTDQITEIFFTVDEYCILFEHHIDNCLTKLADSSGKLRRNKPSGLSDSEVITLLICFHLSDYRTLKHFYKPRFCSRVTQ